MTEQEKSEATVDNDNVLQISKFKGFIKKAKAVMTGHHYEPSIYLETRTVMNLLNKTELMQEFLHLKPERTHYEWAWTVEDGDVLGVTITAFSKDERES